MSNYVSTTGFDYSELEPDLGQELVVQAQRCRSLIRKNMIQFIADFGRLLSEAQSLLANHRNGTFAKWATTEFDLSKSTVYNYVNAWERCLSKGIEHFDNVSPSALYLLSADTTPEAVRRDAKKLAKKRLVTKADVAAMLDDGRGTTTKALPAPAATVVQPVGRLESEPPIDVEFSSVSEDADEPEQPASPATPLAQADLEARWNIMLRELNTLAESVTENKKRKATALRKIANLLDPPTKFVAPTLDEVTEYITSQRYDDVDPEAFFAYFDSQGWRKSNGQKVSNWKGCVLTFHKKNQGQSNGAANGKVTSRVRSGVDYSDYEIE